MLLQETIIQSILKKEITVTEGSVRLGVSRQTIHTKIQRYKKYGSEGLLRKKNKRIQRAHNRTSEHIETIVINLSKEYWRDGVETTLRSFTKNTHYIHTPNYHLSHTQEKQHTIHR